MTPPPLRRLRSGVDRRRRILLHIFCSRNAKIRSNALRMQELIARKYHWSW